MLNYNGLSNGVVVTGSRFRSGTVRTPASKVRCLGTAKINGVGLNSKSRNILAAVIGYAFLNSPARSTCRIVRCNLSITGGAALLGYLFVGGCNSTTHPL